MKRRNTHTLFARWLTISMGESRINKQFPVLLYSSQTQRANTIAERFPFADVASFSGQSADGAGISRCLQRRRWKLTKINNGCLLFLSATYCRHRCLWPTLWPLPLERKKTRQTVHRHMENPPTLVVTVMRAQLFPESLLLVGRRRTTGSVKTPVKARCFVSCARLQESGIHSLKAAQISGNQP